jgi:hypothetical protein
MRKHVGGSRTRELVSWEVTVTFSTVEIHPTPSGSREELYFPEMLSLCKKKKKTWWTKGWNRRKVEKVGGGGRCGEMRWNLSAVQRACRDGHDASLKTVVQLDLQETKQNRTEGGYPSAESTYIVRLQRLWGHVTPWASNRRGKNCLYGGVFKVKHGSMS